MKYSTVAACPITMYGASTGRPPIHVNTAHVLTRVQNNNLSNWIESWSKFISLGSNR